MTKKQSESIIDELKQAYFNSYHEQASLDDLAEFDPFPDKALANEYEELTAKCEKSWWASRKALTEENVKTFFADFGAFTKFLEKIKKEDLKLFQILKWSRERVLGRREVRKGVTTTYGGTRYYLGYEFYLQTVFALLLRAIQIKHLKRNYAGFTSAEDYFFFSPITGAPYYSNYENRFKFVVKDVTMFAELTHRYLRLILYAESRYLELLSDRDALKIQDTLDAASQDPARKRKLKEMAFSTKGCTPYEFAKASFKIGDKVGVKAGRYTIIYFQPLFRDCDAPIYVEFDKFPGFLFKITISQFTDRIEAIPRLLVWEYNKGLLQLIPSFFEVFGYLPTVVSGGFTALIKEILEDIVIEKAIEAGSSALGPSGEGGGFGLPSGRRLAKTAWKIDDRLGRLADTDNRLNNSADATANTGIGPAARGVPASPESPLLKARKSGKITIQEFKKRLKNDYGFYVYRLVDESGNVIKYGTSDNPIKRISKYSKTEKETFSRMEVISGLLSRFEALKAETKLINDGLELDTPTLNARAKTISEMKGGADWADVTHSPKLDYESGRPLVVIHK